MFKIPRDLDEDTRTNAGVINDYVIGPLEDAHQLVEDALCASEDNEFDIPEQREYTQTQIESLIYMLNRIKEEM